ncbi:MAG: ribonuclease P protein component [Salibacteraceae bacterium]
MPLTNRFPKRERLTQKRLFDDLFKKANRTLHFPILAIWKETVLAHDTPIQIGFSVPKKSFRSAAQRNSIKRKLREAYRLNSHDLKTKLIKHNIQISVLLVIMKTDNTSYEVLRDKMILLLRDIASNFEHDQ